MVNKTKNKVLTDSYTKSIGLFVMSLATVVGMLKVSDRTPNRYLLPSQMVKIEYNNSDNAINNPIQREKEDTAVNYVSYSQTQRTAPRSSKG